MATTNTTATTTSTTTATSMLESVLIRFKSLGINLLAIDFDMTIIDIHTGGRWTGTPDELAQHHIRPEFRQLIRACWRHDIAVAVVTFSPQTAVVQHALHQIVNPGGGSSSSYNYNYRNTPILVTTTAQPATESELAAASYVIPIRGGDRTWQYQGTGSRLGKQAHIASAVEELLHHHEAHAQVVTAAAASSDDGTHDDNNNNNNNNNNNTTATASSSSSSPSLPLEITKQTTILIDDDRRNIKHALQDKTRAVWFNPEKPHHLFRDLARLV